MFKKEYIVKLPDTDAAAVLFFGSYFKLAHEAYESMMAEIGYSLKYVLEEAKELLLIVHAEADYRQPLRLEDKYTITIEVSKIGRSSFELSYQFLKEKAVVAELKTVHVAADKKSNKPIKLPEKLINALKSI